MSRDLFESNLPLIERLLAAVCRRNAFPAAEGEEFASWAKLRLIDDDYAVLRKFEGRSRNRCPLTDFLPALTVVALKPGNQSTDTDFSRAVDAVRQRIAASHPLFGSTSQRSPARMPASCR
jgi:hypothetical protein